MAMLGAITRCPVCGEELERTEHSASCRHPAHYARATLPKPTMREVFRALGIVAQASDDGFGVPRGWRQSIREGPQ